MKNEPVRPSTSESTTDRPPGERRPTGGRRQPYLPPKLERHGDLRTLILSPSAGTFESGPGAGFRT